MKQIHSFNQAYQQTPWRSQVRIIGLLFLILLIIGLMASIYLSITAEVTRYGRDIQDIQRTISVIEMNNAAALADLSKLQSLEVMRMRSESLGFIDASIEEKQFMAVENFSAPLSYDLPERSQPELAEASMIPIEYTETIFSWISRILGKYMNLVRASKP
jgi:hypothetical protein